MSGAGPYPFLPRPIVACLFGLAVLLLAAGLCAAGETADPAVALGVEAASAPRTQDVAAASPSTRRALEAFDLSPAVFIENKGQWDESVRYGFDGRGVRVSFTDSGPVFQMVRRETGEARPQPGTLHGRPDAVTYSQAVFSASFVGAKSVRPMALEPTPSSMNFYRGSDKSKWQTGVQTYSKILYKGLYDGVDLCTWGRRSGLKYEFHVAPGASWEKVVIRYDRVDGLSVDESGALHVKTPRGEIFDQAPLAYQDTAEGRREIPCRFRLIDDRSYGFEVTGAYDMSLPLVLDPLLFWGSYLGGTLPEYGITLAVDASGNVWVAGLTGSFNFPVPGGFDTQLAGSSDCFVAKISPSGTLAWGTYLGGTGEETPRGSAADAKGNFWVVGDTDSPDFPVPGGFDTTLSGEDAFVARISPSGALVWSSFLGGSQSDFAWAVAIDKSGKAWVVGETSSSDFPVRGRVDKGLGSQDAFVARISSSGALEVSGFLGGSGQERGFAVAADKSGNAWVTGQTWSPDFPVPGGFDTTYTGPASDAFVAKVAPSGSLVWASYLGGSERDSSFGIAVDRLGDVWVAGLTESSNFPTPGGFDSSFNGGDCDAFVAKITPSGTLAWASYLGGSGVDAANSIAFDPLNNVWVAGGTGSLDFPTPGGFDTSFNFGDYDAFAAKITPSGALAWATFLGGSGIDYWEMADIAADPCGNLWMTGATTSFNFPVPFGFDGSLDGALDAYVASILWPSNEWLDIVNSIRLDYLRLSLPQNGRDSVALRATFNKCLTTDIPRKVTVTIDNWSLVMDVSSWKRVGKTNTFVCKEGDVSAKITYYVKGTSRCLFSLTASRQAIQDKLPNIPSLPVKLKLGPDFGKTAIAEMSVTGSVATMTSRGPMPVFLVDKLSVTRNVREPAHDAFRFNGRLFLTRDFDPATDQFHMNVDGFHFAIPAGTMPAAKGGVIGYSMPTANGTLNLRLDFRSHALAVNATGVDLSSITPESVIVLTITNHADATWYYGLLLGTNKSGTAFAY